MSMSIEPPKNDGNSLHLLKKRHEKFMVRVLQTLPESMKVMETHRLTIAFFAVSSLDILGAIENLSNPTREEIIEWVYSLQVPCSDVTKVGGGFRGSDFLTFDSHGTCHSDLFNSGHVAATYTGLSALIILGDDLSRVNREAVCSELAALQSEDGCIRASTEEADSDMRHIYSAAAISYILNDWSGFNTETATKFVLESLRYEGAFAQGPDLESHSGSTYCAVASLFLMGTLNRLSNAQVSKLVRWCIYRLKEGFNGRPNKLDDTCYSFWVGATLSILCGSENWVPKQISKSSQFVLSTQNPIVGGMAKCPDNYTDPMHTYFGLSGLSLGHSSELLPIHPALNMTQRAFQHLQALHQTVLARPS